MITIRDRAHMSIGRSFTIFVKGYYKPYPEYWGYGNGYHYGALPPRYPVPAVMTREIKQLNYIACEPLLGWEDFAAISYYGKR